ncbi:metallopeptidase domain-containing protein [Pseudomonas sp. GT1P32]
MRKTMIFCLASILAGCASNHIPDNEFVYDERDAIPSDIPLPKPGVNQRPIVGVKKVLVSVVNWEGETILDTPLTLKDTLSTDPNSLRTYILAASHGKLTLEGQVISHTSGPRPEECKSGGPSYPMALSIAEGEKAARAHGLDPKDFDFLINVISCRGMASAYVPGRYMGVYGQGSPHLFKHEFGHNLGYSHGNTYTRCPTDGDTVAAPANCTTIGYGDTGDSVSGGGTLYPASNRWYSGWLDISQAIFIGHTGFYSLNVLGGEGPQLYLISRAAQPFDQLTLEYRKPTRFDDFPPSDNRVNGVWVRYTKIGLSLHNTQLDASPETPATDDPTLLSGKILKDESGGITVKTCTTSLEGATLAIAINGEALPDCLSR